MRPSERLAVTEARVIDMNVDLKEFLQKARIMVIAVVDEAGEPWAVPVGIRSYENGKLEWVSMSDTIHSQAIERNTTIAISIFEAPEDPTGNVGFYAKARAQKVSDLGGGAAIYEAQCLKAWYNDHTRIKRNIDLKDL